MKILESKLLDNILERNDTYHKYELEDALLLVKNQILIELNKGNSVELKNLGVISKKIGKLRKYKSGLTGEEYEVQTKNTIKIATANSASEYLTKE